jgi:hypothetical protein
MTVEYANNDQAKIGLLVFVLQVRFFKEEWSAPPVVAPPPDTLDGSCDLAIAHADMNFSRYRCLTRGRAETLARVVRGQGITNGLTVADVQDSHEELPSHQILNARPDEAK